MISRNTFTAVICAATLSPSQLPVIAAQADEAMRMKAAIMKDGKKNNLPG